MSRPLRVDIRGGWYHVVNRGIDRRRIFDDRRDYLHFLELLGEVAERYLVEINAFVLMRNHYHLLLRTPKANLSSAMQWLNVSYSVWYNRRHDRIGPLFQGRFRAIVVEDGTWILDLSEYIHLNPIRTEATGLGKEVRGAEHEGMGEPPNAEEIAMRLKSLREYEWSSYPAYAGYKQRPTWLVTEEILGRAACKGEDGQARYRELIENERVCLREAEPWQSRIKAGLALGSEAFWELIRKKLKGVGREHSGREEVREHATWERIVKVVEKEKGEDWGTFKERHGDWGRDLVLWAAQRYSGMTLRAIGKKAGGLDYTAVAMGISRFKKLAQTDRRIRTLTLRLPRLLKTGSGTR